VRSAEHVDVLDVLLAKVRVERGQPVRLAPANPLDQPSITIHIYGGEMSSCHVFEPAGAGRYVRRDRALAYHD